MVVTYAWKIDNNLYAYIVNDAYLDNGGNVIEGTPMDDFKGLVTETRLSEAAEKKIYLYCQNNWPTHNATEFAWYTECFEAMLTKIRDYEYPSYFYVTLLDPDIYFNIDEECDVTEKDCCVYIPDGDDVTDCNKQGNYNITTAYNVGGISKGTPLYLLAGKSFSELFNIIFFGDKCGNIAPPEEWDKEFIYVEPDKMTVDGKNKLFIEPSSITVKAYDGGDFIFIDPSKMTVDGKN